MHSFRLRLILALIAGVTVVSVVSTYLEVLAYKHNLREELEWRSTWMGASIRSQVESALAAGNASALPDMVERLRAQIGVLGVGVYDPDGHRTVSAGAPAVLPTWPVLPSNRSQRHQFNPWQGRRLRSQSSGEPR